MHARVDNLNLNGVACTCPGCLAGNRADTLDIEALDIFSTSKSEYGLRKVDLRARIEVRQGMQLHLDRP